MISSNYNYDILLEAIAQLDAIANNAPPPFYPPPLPVCPAAFPIRGFPDEAHVPHGWATTWASGRGGYLATYPLQSRGDADGGRVVAPRIRARSPLADPPRRPPAPERRRQRNPKAYAARARWKQLRRS